MLRYTNSALADLDAILDFIAMQNPQGALGHCFCVITILDPRRVSTDGAATPVAQRFKKFFCYF